jgi:hypothetical protein
MPFNNFGFVETIGWSLLWTIGFCLRIWLNTIFNNSDFIWILFKLYIFYFYFHLKYQYVTAFNNFDIIENIGWTLLWSIWILFKPLKYNSFQQFFINLKKQFITTFNNYDLVESIGWSLHHPFGYFSNSWMITVLNNLELILKKVHLNLSQFWFSLEHRDHYFEPFGFCFRIQFISIFNNSNFIETIRWSLHWAIWKFLKLLNSTVFNNLLLFKQSANHYFQ